MNRPSLRVLTASWPGRKEPWRARFIRDLHLELADNFETTVIAPQIHSQDPLYEDDGSLKVRRFRYLSGGQSPRQAGMGWISKFTWLRGMQNAAQQWQRVSAPSLILTHWAVPAAGIARRTARRLGCPYVVWCHGSDIHVYGRTSIGGWFLRRGLSEAARVLVASEEMAKELQDRHNFGNAQVLPVGIDPDFIESPRASFPEWPLKLLWVGERIASKGYQRMLESVQVAVENGCSLSLEVIGEGPLDRLHADQEIDLRGSQDPAEVRAAMDRSHLLLLPSCGEGTPLVVQEAVARGLPVAATPVGGIPALFPDQQGWFRLDGDTDFEISNSLTGLLMDLSRDPEILGRSRAALLNRDVKQYSRQRCAEELSRIVSEVLD